MVSELQFNQVVTRLRAPFVEDRQNNQVRDWPHAVALDIDHVHVAPFSGNEQDQMPEARDQQFATVKIQSRRGFDLDLLVTDRIEWFGDKYNVVQVQKWPHPTAGPPKVHHVEVLAEKVIG